jgi:sec-independent protein translocase protein TatA
MELSFTKLLLILLIVFVFFGAGRLPQVMGEIGRGMRALKDGLKKDNDGDDKPPVNPST